LFEVMGTYNLTREDHDTIRQAVDRMVETVSHVVAREQLAEEIMQVEEQQLAAWTRGAHAAPHASGMRWLPHYELYLMD
jgi:hypothetical protein